MTSTTSSAAPLLRAEGVTVGTRLLDATLSLAAGALTVVVGENGAGKSTLLDALAGILDARDLVAGRVVLVEGGGPGVDVRALAPNERARKLASLGQRSIDVDDISAFERIAHGLVPKKGAHALVDDGDRTRISAVASELGVAHLLTRALGTLSNGERRRVEVARALVDEDALCFIVDEPHAGVDVKHQGLVSRALKARAARGKIVVVSIHDLGVGLAVADRVVGLKEGRVVVDGPAREALTAASIELLYGVTGARVVDDGADGAVGVLLPRA